MDLQDLGSIGEMIGAVAVVVSLIYFAVQIRQNTNAVAANTQQGLMDAVSTIQASLSEHPDLPGLFLKANANPDDLTPEEDVRIDFLAARIFGQYETAFIFYRKQLMEPDLWQPWDNGFAELVRVPALRKYWNEHRQWHSEAFRAHVDQHIFDSDA